METLNYYFWCMLIGGLVQLAVLIFLIVKFLELVGDVKALRNKADNVPEKIFKKEFYKWIAIGNKEKAKEILINEIGNSDEFNRIIQGVNEHFINNAKKDLAEKYSSELNMVDASLNLDIIDPLQSVGK